jgi:hypothetical protein
MHGVFFLKELMNKQLPHEHVCRISEDVINPRNWTFHKLYPTMLEQNKVKQESPPDMIAEY